jgi:hypothetical protein
VFKPIINAICLEKDEITTVGRPNVPMGIYLMPGILTGVHIYRENVPVNVESVADKQQRDT